jgi:flagellar hook assembly protein FlgD
VRAILLDDSSPTEVVDMVLDGNQDGSLSLPQIGSTHDEVVLVYAGAQTAGATTYMYGAEADVVGVPVATSLGEPSLSARVRSGTVEIAYSLPGVEAGERVTLEVFDPAGRRVRAWSVIANGSPVEDAVRWDARTDGGHTVASGTYFVRLSAVDTRIATQVVVLR